ALAAQNLNLPKLRDDLVGLVSLVCHCGPLSWSKPYFKVAPFNGGGAHRELQCSPARRTPRRRDLLHAQRGQDHRGKLASALQHRASAWIARLQAAGAGGLHPGIRAGGPATPTSDAARAGATTIIALT